MIVPELEFFEIQREPGFGDAMVLHQSLFGPAPEPLQAVDVDPARGEELLVVYFQVPVATKHQAVIAAEAIGIDHAASANLLDGELEQSGRRDVRDHADVDLAVALQDAKDRHFASSASASLALAPTAEVGLVELDLAAQQALGIFGMAQDGHSDRADRTIDAAIGQAQLQGH